LEHFCLLQAAQEQNKTFAFLKNDIKAKPKLFKLCQGFLKTKQNFWLSQKNFWKRTKTKAFGQKFSSTD